MPSEEPVLLPSIIPYFYANKIQVDKIAARRSRSIAVSTTNQVYEWGFVGSEGTQFTSLYELPEECS